MKREKKAAASFKKLNIRQLGGIKGGGWMEYTDENGNIIRVWV